MFVPNSATGFMPREAPILRLPEPYEAVNTLLEQATLVQPDGSAGLLADGQLGPRVLATLPDYDINHLNENTDPHLLWALFRDFSYLASEYLLEPCDVNYRATGDYGLARDHLPASIVKTLVRSAELVGLNPFLDYTAYMLYNYRLVDPSKPMVVENLDTIRKFHGTPSEIGFIVVHTAMGAWTGNLVDNAEEVLQAAEAKDATRLTEALKGYRATMMNINRTMDFMWKESNPDDYKSFRTFIFGIKNQKFFPNGVVYEGVGDDTPRFYRGETGANDSIIPTCDNLLNLEFPPNPLTQALAEFREYRPATHTEFLANVLERSQNSGLKAFAMSNPQTALHYLSIVDQVREFRQRHWNFTKEYIVKKTDYPMATGGTPVIYWLPNQLAGVLTIMEEILPKVEANTYENAEERELLEFLKRRTASQLNILQREVASLADQHPDISKDYA
jgi:indoleamine 2,3-dioxygenase